jgi:PAS domain S-box-containing protein
MTTTATRRDRSTKPDISPSDFPVPAALFSSRRLLECNTLFADLFVPVGDGQPGSLTLTAFAGERNAAFAKELARIVNSAEPMHSPVVKEVALRTREGERRFVLSALPATYDSKRALRVVVQDITAYGERARQAEEAEARYRAFVESSTAAIALVRDGLFVYVNKGLLDLLGYMFSEEMMAKETTQFFAGRDRKAIAEYGRVSDTPGKLPTFVECTAVRKDDSRFRMQVRTEVLTVEDQPTLLWHCVDVSHWRDAEEAVEQKARENDTLEHLLEAVHQSVDIVEVQHATLAASLRRLGYESGGLFVSTEDGNTLLLETQEHLSPALAEKLHELPAGEGLMGYITKTMEPVRLVIEEYPAHLPYRALFESESIRALAFLPLVHGEKLAGVLMLLSSKAHEVPAYHQTFLEVVARHLGFSLAKAAVYGTIQRRADSYQDAIEQVAGVVYVACANGTMLYCSPVVERLTGFKVREITSTPDAWRAAVHPDDRSIAAERISRQAGTQDEFVLEYRMLPKGKASYIQVRDAIRYVRTSDGAVQAIYGLLTDITEQRITQQRMQGISESPAARSDAVEEFTRVVSHDLKEPLITIAGYTKLVLDGCTGLDDESRDHLNTVMRSSVRMRQLIDDLLNLSRIGRVRANQRLVAVSPLLDDLVRDLEFFLHGRRARVEYPPDLPPVHCDPTELGIVFRNLIVNGVLHNTQETPVVRIAASQDKGVVTYSLADNGIGIDPADIHRIFDIFQRLQPTDDRPGTGAGLTIVKKVIETFGGKIWLESTPNVGSTFFFTVPFNG